ALRPGETGTLQAAAPASTPPTPSTPAVSAPPSAMDALVQRLPDAPDTSTATATGTHAAAAAVTVASVASPAPAGRRTGLADHPGYGREEDRFRMVDDGGRVRSADEFDAWMRARKARLDAADAASADVPDAPVSVVRSEEHTSELQSRENLVCRLL